MMGNSSFENVFREIGNILYANNSLTLHDIQSMAPFERMAMVDLFIAIKEDQEQKRLEAEQKR